MLRNESVVLIALARPNKEITLDDIYMVTTDLEEVKFFIQTAIIMNKTKYLDRTGNDAVTDFMRGWDCLTTVGDDVSKEYICSEMTDRLSNIHMQVWQDGEIRGGRLYE